MSIEGLLLLSLLVGGPLLIYVGSPLLSWWINVIKVNPDFIPFDPAQTQMPIDVRTTFAYHHECLTRLGFRYLHTVSNPEALVHQVCVNYVHDEKLCLAELTALHRAKWGVQLPVIILVTFSYREREEAALSTSNYSMYAPASPFVEFRQYPEVMEVEPLWNIHEATLAQRGIVPKPSAYFENYVRNPLDAERILLCKVYAQMAKDGQLVLTADGTKYRASLWFSFYIIWIQLPPWSLVANYKRKMLARQRIAELEAGGWLQPP